MVKSAATVSTVTSRPVSAYTPLVINRSCISAISTGTANFHSKRSATYAEITSSEAMIAITALLAMVRPNVGPTEVESNDLTPNWDCSLLRTCATLAGWSCLEEIWKTLLPSALLVIFCTSGLPAPADVITERIWASLAGWTRLVVILVPDVKSMPRLRPLPPIARAPISRITPDSEKNHLEAPMKSKRHSRFLPPAPRAEGREIVRELPIVLRIACVAITAVNSDTNVPIPNVNAKPFTSEVA